MRIRIQLEKLKKKLWRVYSFCYKNNSYYQFTCIFSVVIFQVFPPGSGCKALQLTKLYKIIKQGEQFPPFSPFHFSPPSLYFSNWRRKWTCARVTASYLRVLSPPLPPLYVYIHCPASSHTLSVNYYQYVPVPTPPPPIHSFILKYLVAGLPTYTPLEHD